MWTMSSAHNGLFLWAQAKHRTHGFAQSSSPKYAMLTSTHAVWTSAPLTDFTSCCTGQRHQVRIIRTWYMRDNTNCFRNTTSISEVNKRRKREGSLQSRGVNLRVGFLISVVSVTTRITEQHPDHQAEPENCLWVTKLLQPVHKFQHFRPSASCCTLWKSSSKKRFSGEQTELF